MTAKEINEAFAPALEAMRKAANGSPKLEKGVAIIDATVAMANELVALAGLMGRRKRIFQPVNRMPKKRINQRKKIFEKLISIQMLDMKRHVIAATPIPKYQPGGESFGGILPERGC